jgi:hypothetical protein
MGRCADAAPVPARHDRSSRRPEQGQAVPVAPLLAPILTGGDD